MLVVQRGSGCQFYKWEEEYELVVEDLKRKEQLKKEDELKKNKSGMARNERTMGRRGLFCNFFGDSDGLIHVKDPLWTSNEPQTAFRDRNGTIWEFVDRDDTARQV